jgi:hypothetical protein
MWRVDMGPNSANTDLSRPGPAAIGIGHADNEGAYDIDCDGIAEVLVKGANGTIFGDGKVLEHSLIGHLSPCFNSGCRSDKSKQTSNSTS